LRRGLGDQRPNASLKTAIPASAVNVAVGRVFPRRCRACSGECRELDQLSLAELRARDDDGVALSGQLEAFGLIQSCWLSAPISLIL
jgi:hypothetical protein